jgi:integrase
MPRPKVPQSASLISLLPDWIRELKAQNKSPRTIRNYPKLLQHFCRYLSPDGDAAHCTVTVTEVSRELLAGYFGYLYSIWSESSVQTAHIALSSFFHFCLEYDELTGENPMRWVKRPKPIPKETPILSDEEIRALLATCDKSKAFMDKRDYAILRTFLATGLRVDELGSLLLSEVHLDEGLIHIRRGKGGKPRTVAIGPKVVRALGQYIHVRARHLHVNLPDLWLGRRGKLQPATIRWMVYKRAEEAHIEHLHPHMFRHWFAHGYLASGGQESDLLQLAGWSDSRMIRERYGASRATERAVNEHHRLGIGEKF